MSMPGFAGACAPFLYVDQCPPRQRDAYILASRIWIAPNAIAFLALLITFIRRIILVEERFNTLRLLLLKFTIGIPLHIIFDVLRAASPKAFGTPLAVTSFLWVMGWVPVITGMILLTITWMAFSSKNLLARPAVTGSWPLYLSIIVPYILTSLIGSTICGVNYRYYFIAMRAVLSAWSAMFLMLFAACLWYGRKTLIRIKASGDNFSKNQQLRAFLVVATILFSCGVTLGINGYFMDAIDKSLTWFLLITTFYRLCGLSLYLGGAFYVWRATSRWVKYPPGSTLNSQLSARSLDSQLSPRSQRTADPESPTTSSEMMSGESENIEQEQERLRPHDETGKSDTTGHTQDPHNPEHSQSYRTASKEPISDES